MLWNVNVYYHIHKSLLLVPILSQLNPVLTLTPYVFEIRFNIILPSSSECPKWPFFFRFADKLLYALPMSIMPVVCFAHIIHFYLNVITFRGDQYNKTNEIHFLYSIYYELAASPCLEQYLLIFRRRCTNNNWYFACMLCLLVATRIGVDQFQFHSNPGSSQQTQHTCKIPMFVCAVPPENEQVVLEICRGC
jgi:hypothetical protein